MAPYMNWSKISISSGLKLQRLIQQSVYKPTVRHYSLLLSTWVEEFSFCLCCAFFSRNITNDWECCKHTPYITQHSAHVTAARGLLHRSPPPAPPDTTSTQPLSMLTAASSPVTLRSVMLRRVARLPPEGKKKGASSASAALKGDCGW